eukprot:6209456-Pleurochrysis_carterae.AAC.1
MQCAHGTARAHLCRLCALSLHGAALARTRQDDAQRCAIFRPTSNTSIISLLLTFVQFSAGSDDLSILHNAMQNPSIDGAVTASAS